jgi:hypothetical protein
LRFIREHKTPLKETPINKHIVEAFFDRALGILLALIELLKEEEE